MIEHSSSPPGLGEETNPSLSRCGGMRSRLRRGILGIALLGLVTHALAVDPRIEYLRVRTAPENYNMTSAPVVWADLVIDDLYSGYWGNLNRPWFHPHWDVHVDFHFTSVNGITYEGRYVHQYDGSRSFAPLNMTGDVDYQKTTYLPASDYRSVLESNRILKFSNEQANLVAAINAWVVSNWSGMLQLPPPDPNDRRKLAIPVLFIHGAGDSASRWGVSYARRQCRPVEYRQLVAPRLQFYSFSSTKMVQKYAANPSTGALEPQYRTDRYGKKIPVMESVPATRWKSYLDFDGIQTSCDDGSIYDAPSFWFRDWVQPGVWDPTEESAFPESSPLSQISVDAAGKTLRIAVAVPSSVDPGTIAAPADPSIEMTELLKTASTSPMGWTKAISVVSWGGKWWTIHRVDFSYERLASSARFDQELNVVPQGVSLKPGEVQQPTLAEPAQKLSLVSRYANGSAPDILARIEHLDRTYKWWDPKIGINNNGIYFYTAWLDDENWRGSPPAPWMPSEYPEYSYMTKYGSIKPFPAFAGRGQAFQLYQRLVEVLDKEFPDWRTNPSAKVDLVAHSQGGLLVREMIGNLGRAQLPDGTNMPTGLAHPAAHIRKFVDLNTPHFGSTFGARESEIDPLGEFGVVRDFKNWMQTSRELKPRTRIDQSTIENLTTTGAATGGCASGALIGTIVPGPGTAVGCVLGGAGAGLYAALAGTDVYWSMNGKAMGPYELHVDVDLPGPFNIDDLKTDINPGSLKQIRDPLLNSEQTGFHLSPASRWIADMKAKGYPRIPTSGGTVPLWTQTIYTPGLPMLRTDIGTEISAIQTEYCNEHADDWIETCDILSWMLKGVQGYDGDDQGFFYTFFRDFHTKWAAKSDLVVETASQKLVWLPGYDPQSAELLGYFQEPIEFQFQKEFAIGSAKEVAHGGINQRDALELPGGVTGVDDSKHSFELHRPGASRMGPDIYAALYGDHFLRTGIHPVSEAAPRVAVPDLVNLSTVSLSGRLAGDLETAIQDVATTGDFSVRDWSNDPLVHGVGVRTAATAPLSVAAFYDRRQGSFLWVKGANGSPDQKVVLGGPNRPASLSLARAGSAWTAIATFQDGTTATAVLTASLPAATRVGVLSSAAGRADQQTPLALTGQLTRLPDPAVDAVRAWDLQAYVRETSFERNQSSPRIVLHNADTRPLVGVHLEYWFTADPARVPVVEVDRIAGATWKVYHQGGDQYVLKIDAPNAVVPAGGVFPDPQGIWFRLHNQDWSPRWSRGDWSRDHNIGIAQKTSRIVVRDASGRILSGELPPGEDPARVAKVVVMARDAGSGESNFVKPVLRIRNVGAVPLRAAKVLWFVKVPVGSSLLVSDWDTPEASLSSRELQGGIWEVSIHLDQYRLFPQQETGEIQFGISLKSGQSWNKSEDPSRVGGDLVEHRGVLVFDDLGRRIWGDLPDFTTMTVSPRDPGSGEDALRLLNVEAREEAPGDLVYARPRIRVTNTGAQDAKGFQLGIWVDNPGAVQPILDASWYVPGCDVRMQAATVGQKLVYSCPDVTISAGGTWPDPAGSVAGLHLPQWQKWGRSSSWSLDGLTGAFAPTTRITVETLSGTIVKGTRP